ncbi:MAG TPA: hypothetical protein VFI35_07475 [Actinomycetota bacterium]|nr:hypothetical protein [Actinomycetota bacterium]
MIRALPLVLLVVLVVALARWVLAWSMAAAARRPTRRGSSRMGGYEFESRIEGLKRRRRSSSQPFERREGIDEGMEEFLNAHSDVEAYVEPETVVSPRSVVLVDGAGEWRRFPLSEDSVLRRVAGERGIRIFDASRTGYPSRMRRGPGPAT